MRYILLIIMTGFALTINSEKRNLYKGKADFLDVPSIEGRLTVLAHHAPLLSILNSGKIVIKNANVKEEFDIKEGFIEVNKKGVTVLAKE